MRSHILAVFVSLCCVASARAGFLDGGTILYTIDNSTFTSQGDAAYFNDAGNRTAATLVGEHVVTQVYPEHDSFVFPLRRDDGYYWDVVSGPTVPGGCYETSLHVVAYPSDAVWPLENTWYGYTQRCDPRRIQYRLQFWTCLDGACTSFGDEWHDIGDLVVVNASAPSNYLFNGWSGDVMDTNGLTARVLMDRDKSVSANWTAMRYRLEVWTCLDGSCTLQNNDLHDFRNTVVVNTSGPPNYQFNGWSGDVSSTYGQTAEVYMDRDKSVSANWSSPPNPPPGPPEIIYEDSDCPQYQNCHSPIVLNMGGGGYEFSGKDDSVLFDIDANGKPIGIAWTARGASMAFLALDRNHNGQIDDGSELFGNHTPLPGGATAANGFKALVPYDANSDGIIDARDPIWSALLLWTDLSHDGISQASELLPVSQSTVDAISLDYHWSGRRDASGNHFRYESKVWMNHGGRQATPRPVYDVFFEPVPYAFVPVP